MKQIPVIVLFILLTKLQVLGQSKLANVKSSLFKTTSNLVIQGQEGFLEIPENRNDPSSRTIKLKYVHLKSISENPSAPIIYLEGGGGASTWEASSPKDLNDRIELLEVSDLIFLDRRGANDESLTYIWRDDYPKDFFVSEENANRHYQQLAKVALEKFSDKGIDVTGYNIEEHAKDVNDLMTALGFEKYTLFGFSYGSHIGMTVMKLFPDYVERAIMVGADAPNQAFNYPIHLDEHLTKIAALVEQDSMLNMTAADFITLVNTTMTKLQKSPVIVKVKNPLTRKKIDLPIGVFGLAFILRLDIDDWHDISAIPRLLHSINNNNYSMLTWFVQKRMTFALGIQGQGINQQLASGASESRWSTIEKQANESLFGNAVNFPFSAVKDYWVSNKLSFDPSIPLQSDIPTLFITGTLDCRTPVKQTEEIMKGFSNAIHIKVENAGHEQAQWEADVANTIIPTFLRMERIETRNTHYSDIKFIRLSGKASGHPSIK